MDDYRMLIDGRLVAGPRRLEVIDPAMGEPFATAGAAGSDEVEAAIAAAAAAFPAWAARSPEARRAALLALADAMEAQFLQFAQTLTLEQGKTLAEAQGEVGGAIAALRVLSHVELPAGVLREDEYGRILRQRTPLGVTVAITPWNFPLMLLMVKVAPALATGNCIVAKPAATTPLTTLMFGALCAEHLPAGVLNVVVDNNDLGDLLTSHPQVAKVAFTGSTATGRRVMASAAGTLKRLTLELGGNDPAIVLPDADLETAAPALYAACTPVTGQVCLAVKRIYAHTSIHDELCERLADLARRTVLGPGSDPAAQMGPVQNPAQLARLRGLLDEAQAQGRVLAGGKTLDRPGYFVEPTVVAGLPDTARLVREEQFGPILPVLRFTDEDEAVRRANDSEYGLGASVWTADREHGLALAMRLEAGAVWVNRHLDAAFDTPFCAAKQSGVGYELGPEGVAEFTQSKIINVAP